MTAAVHDEGREVRGTVVQARWEGRPLGAWWGFLVGLLGGLTFLTAAAVGSFLILAWSLVWAAVIWLLWPRVFSPEMTTWVFSTPRPAYWKVLLIVVVIKLILRTSHRR